MSYVEILRGRRVLMWYGGILIALFAFFVFSFIEGHGQADIHREHSRVDVSALLLGCAFGAWIVTTCVAGNLNAEGATLPIIWTRPTSRTAIAWRFVGVDAVTILIGYVFLLVLILAAFAVFGALDLIAVDTRTPSAAAVGLGSALMWYGLVVVATARLSGRGALIAGLSWAVFIVLGALTAAPLPPLVHWVASALNYLSPMAWVGEATSHSSHATRHVIELPDYVRALAVWGIAAISLIAGVRLWSTREG